MQVENNEDFLKLLSAVWRKRNRRIRTTERQGQEEQEDQGKQAEEEDIRVCFVFYWGQQEQLQRQEALGQNRAQKQTNKQTKNDRMTRTVDNNRKNNSNDSNSRLWKKKSR